ncbi:MAG: T9SS type A sorting domain-containing protein [Crocinitomicaceae bacterium]|nr:T9SS type A sorting domain-containing protein [Crocinitomicaceae bacterium]
MLTRTLLLAFLCASSFTYSQDTTWVQTFTYDSISTRRADFSFPAALNDMRFERVLMYYNLKCDPQTPWDGYNCGEWDYLAYTRVFDHTGVLDSVQVDSVRYLNNWMSTSSYAYEPFTGNRIDEFVSIEQMRSGATTTTYPVLAGTGGSSELPFLSTAQSNRYQMILTSAELLAAGVTPGDIQSLSLFVPTGGVSGSGELLHPRISMKSTTDATLSGMQFDGFTEVYNLSRVAGAGAVFVDGENELLFYQPYAWNGTDNIIIEFYYDRSVQLGSDNINFDADNSVAAMARDYSTRNGAISFNGSNQALLELSEVDLGDDITISFWAQGLGNTGVNTSVLEGYDTLNNRILNVHFPWSNNRLYWDAGAGSGYDRIDQDMSAAGIDNEWHHWAFVKDAVAGTMKVFRDGVLWHSGTGLTRSLGELHRLVIGSNRSVANNWTGEIDEFQIFNTAVADADITTWYNQEVTAAHPNWNDLLVYYSFDEAEYAVDKTSNGYLLMPSEQGMIEFGATPVFSTAADRVRVSLGQGTVAGSATNVGVPLLKLKEPEVVFEFGQVNNHFEILNAFLATPEGSEDVYSDSMVLISSVPFSGTDVLNNSPITYYETAYEIINDVEIGRFITPYGIGFDLGSNGFTWIYDVTDYQMYLKDIVDLAAHNTQELIDVKFAFIEGIPPRDVHNREPIWSDFRSYNYGNMDNDVNLQSTDIALSDTSVMYKIKTRFTGHGHNGSVNCCEWDSKDHMIMVDNVLRFQWEIWEETQCGDSPLPGQGGTWPYAREGWCPGDLVREYDHELTPFVTPGSTVTLDYDIEDVPVGDPDQAGGNYVAALDLVSYGAPNFQNDAAIIDVLNPNKWEYYRKWNPSCSNPRIVIQNTGEQELTSLTIRCWISYGDWLEFEWTGSLDFLEKETVEIPVTDLSWWQDYNGEMTFNAQIYNVNGGDEYDQNNFMKVKFNGTTMIDGPFLVWFSTNNRANENKWRLMDASGTTIFERLSLNNTSDYKDTFDLAPGCYSLVIEDSDSDGLGYWYSAQTEGETTGIFRVKNVGGPIVTTFNSDFGNYHRFDFSVGFGLGIEEEELEHNVSVFPNPNDGNFYVELNGQVNNEAELHIIDLTGREVVAQDMVAGANFASSKVDMTQMPAGHYIIKVITNDRVYTEEFIKK